MEIKPMGNTEQEKMSSLWGYFIACCKILDDVTIEYQEPCISDYYLNHISAMQSKTILSGMEKFHTLANERVVKMPSKLYPQGKAVLDVMTAIVAASGKYPIAKIRIADLHEFELLARATIGERVICSRLSAIWRVSPYKNWRKKAASAKTQFSALRTTSLSRALMFCVSLLML